MLKKVSDNRAMLLFALGFVVFFGGIGFVIAMFKPDTRMFFFNSKAYTFYYVLIILGILLVCLRFIDIIDNPSMVLLLGFGAGAIVIYVVSKYVQKAKRNLP